ncbi:hypothetical protein Pla108_22300 [Botrimarina colliarenosi]|uniref:Major Facilitator Superfamily protein n=1 Tax=Botrimarina colliarenosi TaxID=2528001 RepID=A0A5C6ADN0_9BACT|nr:DUF5690 family protein [Botrimarina colliarenosi]TWT98074.1 hypothetical protein Pla108_22300 [Botrimarina colliarenosi]
MNADLATHAARSSRRGDRLTRWLACAGPVSFSAFCIGAAFTTYFCMYAFRKPFTAAEFSDVTLWGAGYKSVLIASQVAGYTLSKFIGIKVIAEMPPTRRAVAILSLIGLAELALLGFAVVPAPFNFPLLFVNGLPLGMVFGLVLSFLEGRRLTEALSAGLCASFIVASGAAKSVGRWLLVGVGVGEYWMPFTTGLLFIIPLTIAVWLLSRIPPPNEADVAQRVERVPMDRASRHAFFRRHAVGLTGLVAIFVSLTILRSLRDDFAVEIWRDLGEDAAPAVFALSETWVMFGVILINGSAAWIKPNRTAFVFSLVLTIGGFALVLTTLAWQAAGLLSPFFFMVMVGVGAYVPYVAFHTTVFERLIALYGERANLGYLMYLADASGYLGYVAVLITKPCLASRSGFFDLFFYLAAGISVVAIALAAALLAHYARVTQQELAPDTRVVEATC